MAVKQSYEIDNIKKACEITDRAFKELLPRIKEGMTENTVASELEYLMRKYGASGTSFSTIVAFGKNSSIPHHETGEDRLKFGDIVLIDYGCKVGGYCSDCTRTFLFGDDKKHDEFKKAYAHVLKAHMLVKENVTDGITGREADGFARDYLRTYGLDKFFTHSLGHGIGINVHEHPMLSPKSLDVLKDGMVFSDEPGVYFEGDFGIRIEDTITLSEGKVISLTNSDKNLIIL
ncbi:MAG: aminopeptidase P family protein [Clostridia bacterium]|nr:aminopeptidase P family protein [Clostridia bacterium]